ncbi:hypothetical protein Clacol_004561 [Clathrus columnatus]|uniref:Uncharacterized protein n=1 Tax=Clathrus columnatus TaxID=1419009 RepID=A0AAV5A7U9_9AGAM|nr:hypothetical protein Clacol_004561 [Clathrus columnatus]
MGLSHVATVRWRSYRKSSALFEAGRQGVIEKLIKLIVAWCIKPNLRIRVRNTRCKERGYERTGLIVPETFGVLMEANGRRVNAGPRYRTRLEFNSPVIRMGYKSAQELRFIPKPADVISTISGERARACRYAIHIGENLVSSLDPDLFLDHTQRKTSRKLRQRTSEDRQEITKNSLTTQPTV